MPDNVGNRTSKTDLRTQVATSYGYDVTYQLLSATQGGNATETYTYDAVGNRLSSLTIPIYVYNSSNELINTTVPGPSTTTYNYDANGNLTSRSGGGVQASYTWDFENRLTSATVNGVTTNFKYDPFGRRVYKSSSAGTTVYVYDGDNLIEELGAMGAEIPHYTQGPGIDEPLAEFRSGTASFYEADGLGSVTSLTNAAGAIAQTYTFDSFGNQTASSGSLTNSLRFTAREFDSETGLYSYRARYYDPSVGRFLSEDPIGFSGGSIDLYPYVGNQAPNSTDPTGLWRTPWHYQTTYDLARAIFGNKPGCEYKAWWVADADAQVDDVHGAWHWIQFITGFGEGWRRGGPHFPDDAMVRTRLDDAFRNCDLDALGQGLHSLQDAIAHVGPYANPRIHWYTTTSAEIVAQQDVISVDAATSATASILRSFKQKCLKCCQ